MLPYRQKHGSKVEFQLQNSFFFLVGKEVVAMNSGLWHSFRSAIIPPFGRENGFKPRKEDQVEKAKRGLGSHFFFRNANHICQNIDMFFRGQLEKTQSKQERKSVPLTFWLAFSLRGLFVQCIQCCYVLRSSFFMAWMAWILVL